MASYLDHAPPFSHQESFPALTGHGDNLPLPEQTCKGFEATNTNLLVVGTPEVKVKVKVGSQGHLQRQRVGAPLTRRDTRGAGSPLPLLLALPISC